MNKMIVIFKAFFFELLIIVILIFTCNNYIGNAPITIAADGIGYYDYLPSVFIRGDMVRKNIDFRTDPGFYTAIEKTGVYITYKEKFKLNKYPCGTAILETPFFLFTWLNNKNKLHDLNGYEKPFQSTIFHAAVFYLFLTLLFLKRTLRLYKIKPLYITFCQLLLALGTNVTLYVNQDASFSHIYSMFAITVFIFLVKSWFGNFNTKHFFLSCIFLALIILLRNINIIIILFIPFLAGSPENLRKGLYYFNKNKLLVLKGITIMISILSIQCLFWYLQTGYPLLYSYTNESFNFLKPHLTDILFSYRKGLFIYTPVIFISCFGLLVFIYKRQYYLLFTWLFFFSSVTYLLSSWWSWYYGSSFGLRAFIDFYSVFFILLALVINESVLYSKIPLCLISIAAIPVNLIQTYQYKAYILHWDNMNKEKYWRVFLKTSENYKGILWKKTYFYQNFKVLAEKSVPNIKVLPSPGFTPVIVINCYEIREYSDVRLIQISFESDFPEDDQTKIELFANDTTNNQIVFYSCPKLAEFATTRFNHLQRGYYDYEIPEVTNKNPQTIGLRVFTNGNKQVLTLYNVKIKFLKPI